MYIIPAMRLLLALALAAGLAHAQPPAKIWRIGYLGDGTSASRAAEIREFRAGMADLGYVDGRNVVIVERWTENLAARRDELAAEFVRLQVDVIVTHGAQAALAVKSATTTIPIVVAVAADFLGSGLVKSLSRPGGNLTGLTDQVGDLAAKEVQLVKEVLPATQLAAIVLDSTNPSAKKSAADMQEAARQLGLRVLVVPVQTAGDLADAFGRIADAGATVAVVIHTPLTVGRRADIAQLALKHRVALIAAPVQFAEAGGLLSYGPDLPRFYRSAAAVVDKILKGAKPADIPIQQPTKFEFVINMKTARALGVAIPQSMLVRADRIID